MSRLAVTDVSKSVIRTSAAAALLFVLLFAPVAEGTDDPLHFFKNYFITGDYVVGGVGLRGQGVTDSVSSGITGVTTKYATGIISISGVPANADILAPTFTGWR